MIRDHAIFLRLLGPAIGPFKRSPYQNQAPLPGECIDFSQKSQNCSSNGPIQFDTAHLTVAECADPYALPQEKKLLWLLDEVDGTIRLRLIPEQTPNPERGKTPELVCHTNLTNCGNACQGGECWWCPETGILYINSQSGRYGHPSVAQWNAVVDAFREIGYLKTLDIDDYTRPLRSKT